jgi:hypothetical protein
LLAHRKPNAENAADDIWFMAAPTAIGELTLGRAARQVEPAVADLTST